jgi:hypothetical protein
MRSGLTYCYIYHYSDNISYLIKYIDSYCSTWALCVNGCNYS